MVADIIHTQMLAATVMIIYIIESQNCSTWNIPVTGKEVTPILPIREDSYFYNSIRI